MKKIFVFLALSCILVSCQKEINFDSPSSGGSGSGGGTGANGSYQPITKGSYWKYHDSQTNSDYTLTLTGEKRTINGIDFAVFTSTPASAGAEGMFGIHGHDLYLSVKGAIPGSTDGINLNFLYANDTASVGYTWDNTAGQANGFTAYTPGKILEKGISLTVAGKNYSNVIHTQIVLQYDLPVLGLVNASTYDYYVAKNIGIVRIVTIGDPNFSPGLNETTDLIDYSIK